MTKGKLYEKINLYIVSPNYVTKGLSTHDILDEAKKEFPKQFLERGTIEYRPELEYWFRRWYGDDKDE